MIMRMLNILVVAFSVIFMVASLPAYSQQSRGSESIQAQEIFNAHGNQVAGNPHGSVTLVEFFGYNCPYCRVMYPVIEKLVKRDPYLRVVYKEYLLFGQRSVLPGTAALAANMQNKYLAMHQAMMTATSPLIPEEVMFLAKKAKLNIKQFKQDMQNPKLLARLERTTKLAHAMGIRGAPTLIIAPTKVLKNPKVKVYPYVGLPEAARIQALINKAHKAA